MQTTKKLIESYLNSEMWNELKDGSEFLFVGKNIATKSEIENDLVFTNFLEKNQIDVRYDEKGSHFIKGFQICDVRGKDIKVSFISNRDLDIYSEVTVKGSVIIDYIVGLEKVLNHNNEIRRAVKKVIANVLFYGSELEDIASEYSMDPDFSEHMIEYLESENRSNEIIYNYD